MLQNNVFLETLITLYTYLFVYNISLYLIFFVLTQFVSFNFKTLYSFSDLKFNFFLTTIVAISLFSIAGVPPFLGFFTKLLILIALLNSNFFFFYTFFFTLLFFGLYFYLQNIKFLYSTNLGKLNYSFSVNLRAATLFFIVATFFIFLIVFGFLFFDDFILFFAWLFN